MNKMTSPIHVFQEHFVFYDEKTNFQTEKSGRVAVDFEDVRNVREYVGTSFAEVRANGIELVILTEYNGEQTIVECTFANALQLLKTARQFTYLSKINFISN